MRIAQVAPLYEPVPPAGYGGTERVVAHLTEALVRQAHDVTLFASGGSRTAAELVPVAERPLRESADWPVLQMERVAALADRFDVIHFHVDALSLPYARRLRTPSLLTLHGRLDLPGLAAYFAEFGDGNIVSISDAQREPLAGLRWLGTVHHGIADDTLEFAPEPAGDYLVFVGRISPEKRPDRAIEIARRAGLRLKIAAKVDPADRAYHERVIRPMLDDPCVEFLGEVCDDAKTELIGNARALLFPIDWPEPFGLILIESMATGTPVIAFRRGAVPEVVDDGITGLIVDDVDAAIEAVQRAGKLDRRLVRRRFEERFTADGMAREYAALYETLATQHHARIAPASAELAPIPAWSASYSRSPTSAPPAPSDAASA